MVRSSALYDTKKRSSLVFVWLMTTSVVACQASQDAADDNENEGSPAGAGGIVDDDNDDAPGGGMGGGAEGGAVAGSGAGGHGGSAAAGSGGEGQAGAGGNGAQAGGGGSAQNMGGAGGAPANANAVRRGLVVQYDFRETSGNVVRDTSGVGQPHDLEMFVTNLIERVPHGVRFKKPPDAPENADVNRTTPIIRSAGASDKINSAVRMANAFSVEIWFKPSVLAQAGPGRMVSIDYTNYELTNLNIMHGPPKCGESGSGQFIQIRMGGEGNACPALPVPNQPNVTGNLQHLVLTQNDKNWVLYSDGEVNGMGSQNKTPANWNTKAGLALGNLPYLPEPGAAHGNFRFWQGELYYVAFYDTALTAAEVKTNAGINYSER